MSKADRLIHRRAFLRTAATATAGTAFLNATKPGRADAANDKIILGLVGAGGRGHQVITEIAKLGGVAVKYVCDADASRGGGTIRELEKITGKAPRQTKEMREVLDDKEVQAVVIATPEHWHALATIQACQAGKDVYVEKHIGLGIWDTRQMVEAARKYNRIVQVGTQNRSAPYALSARDYIRGGELGRVLYVSVYSMLPSTYGGSPFKEPAETPPPAGLDWDRWLGPAPLVPFNQNRLRNWYGYWDYSGGSLAGDASHTLDLARLALGDPPHPHAVSSSGGRLLSKDQGHNPEVQLITYDYDDFVLTCQNTGFTPYITKAGGDVRFGDRWPHWPHYSARIEIYGTKRMMYLGRHGTGWQVYEGDYRGAKLVKQEKGYMPDKWHLPNFLDCVRSRQAPNGNILQGHLSATLVNLANIALRVGNQKLRFDRQAETFIAHDEANKLLRAPGRGSYRIPEPV